MFWSKLSIGLYMIYLLFSVLGTEQGKILQLDSLVTAQEGDDVILSCFHPKEEISKIFWYKQLIGQKPMLVTSSYFHMLSFNFYNGFDKTGRVNLLRAAGSTNLTITKLEPSDAAVYYCASSFANDVRFGAGTILVLKGKDSNKYTVVRQNTLPQILSSGDSVTLQCSLITKSSAGERSVYWFKHGSGESHPGIIYTHGGRSDQCNKSFETDCLTQSCVYNLPKRNLSTSDAGTYYCAVAMCGEILFGKGTKVGFKDEPENQPILIIIGLLSVLLFLSLTVNFALYLVCQKKGSSSQHVMTLDNDTGLRRQNQMSEEMNYAALTFPSKNTRERKMRYQEETVYSGLACENKICKT